MKPEDLIQIRAVMQSELAPLATEVRHLATAIDRQGVVTERLSGDMRQTREELVALRTEFHTAAGLLKWILGAVLATGLAQVLVAALTHH